MRPLIDPRLSPSFRWRVVTVAPGGRRPYDEVEWQDAIVVIEQGEIELECLRGGQRSFGQGDVLFLVGLPLRAIHNPGHEPAVLLAVSRLVGPVQTQRDGRPS